MENQSRCAEPWRRPHLTSTCRARDAVSLLLRREGDAGGWFGGITNPSAAECKAQRAQEDESLEASFRPP